MNFKFIDFLREVGKHITVSYMMAKDSVKNRLDGGISFTEFSYQLLQGYDFLWLYENKNCKLQIGGSDQWGNIVTGTELIRRKISGEAFALTCPLVTKADGTIVHIDVNGNEHQIAQCTFLPAALDAIPGAGEAIQALGAAYANLANIGNDMSPLTRKKAKKVLVLTAAVVAFRRRFGND